MDKDEFFELFRVLTDLPEYRNALRHASEKDEEHLEVKDLVNFLKDEQKFDDIDESKAEELIKKYETREENDERPLVLTINGKSIIINTVLCKILRFFRVPSITSKSLWSHPQT